MYNLKYLVSSKNIKNKYNLVYNEIIGIGLYID